MVGQNLKLYAEVKNVEDGQGLTFEVYDEHSRQIFSKGAKVEGGKAEAEWVYHWNGIKLDAKPKFTFKVTGARCKETESGELEVSATVEIYLKDKNKNALSEHNYILFKDSEKYKSEKFDNEGKIFEENLIPGNYQIIILSKNTES